MGSNERIFKYSIFTIQILSIFPFLCFVLPIRYFKIIKFNLIFIFVVVVAVAAFFWAGSGAKCDT